MRIDRRRFLTHAGLAAASATLADIACQTSAPPTTLARPSTTPAGTRQAALDLSTWEGVRASFELSADYVHLAGMLLASHPAPVREALDAYRRALDENPAHEAHRHHQRIAEVHDAAARYTGAAARDIALTDSTTMGLGLVYSGLQLHAGDELVTTVHDHYATRQSLRFAAARTGAKLREITVYDPASSATATSMTENVRAALTPATRVVALTWVHSATGVKLPIADIAAMIAEENQKRDEAARILLSVDGVHGFGIENVALPALGCDFFIAGTHKWMFGPRGTGMIWGNERAWSMTRPSIPPFDGSTFKRWNDGEPIDDAPPGRLFTPGGFHSFEHRWALKEAFDMHLAIGKARIEERIHTLASQAKEGLAAMKHVTLHTPRYPALSSGIVCFEVAGMSPGDVVDKLLEQHIIASETPYADSYARFSPGLINTPDEVDRALAAVRAMG